MKTDTTDVISNASCYTFNGSDTLRGYRNQTVYIYNLFGNKWIQTSESNYYNQPDYCLSYSTIQELPSPYDFITPIYYLLAILSAIFIFYSAYSLILKPFFRRTV